MSESSPVALTPLQNLQGPLQALNTALLPHLERYSALRSALHSIKTSQAPGLTVDLLDLALLQSELALVLSTLHFVELRSRGRGGGGEGAEGEVLEARKELDKCRRAVKGCREMREKRDKSSIE